MSEVNETSDKVEDTAVAPEDVVQEENRLRALREREEQKQASQVQVRPPSADLFPQS